MRHLHAKRLTVETGYDFLKEGCLSKVFKRKRPCRVWASIPCTAWSSIQNFNQKPKQRAALCVKRRESRRLLRRVLKVLKWVVGPQRHVYFEWPTNSHGWRLPELAAFRTNCIARGHAVHRVRIDGCMYGLRSKKKEGLHLKKSWTILTTDPTFGSACGRCCDGGHSHITIDGIDTAHSGFYVNAMGKAIAKHWEASSR